MSARGREPPVPSASRLIRLLATESSGEILRALSAGPLRSAELTDRLAQFSPRTIYRRLDELEELEAITQLNLATAPPTVLYELTVRPGRELLRVLDQVAGAWLGRWHHGVAEGQRWGLLALLADGWDSAIVRELNSEPRSLSELGVVSDMTYHQLRGGWRGWPPPACSPGARPRGPLAASRAKQCDRRWSWSPPRHAGNDDTCSTGPSRFRWATRWRCCAAPCRSCAFPSTRGRSPPSPVEADDRTADSPQHFGSLQVEVALNGEIEYNTN